MIRIPVLFNKDQALHMTNCLDEGLPITPLGDVEKWTPLQVLALIGVCRMYYICNYPAASKTDRDGMHLERQEAFDEHFESCFELAVKAYTELTMRAVGGEYDEHYDPECLGGVEFIDGEPRFRTISGYHEKHRDAGK